MWLDEIFTLILIEDPSWSHYWQAQGAAGLDNSPPGAAVLGRLIHTVTDDSNQTLALGRAICFTLVLLGLWCMYLTFRHSASPMLAWLGVLAIWAHPMLYARGVEIRGYGPWFACTAGLLLALVKCDHSKHWLLIRIIVLAMSFLCGMFHYIALVSTGLVLLGHWLGRLSKARFIDSFFGGVGAILAVVVCLPLLKDQVNSAKHGAWFDDLTIDWFWSNLLPLPLLLLFCGVVLAGERLRKSSTRLSPSSWIALLSTLFLLLIPVVLTASTLAGRPMLLHRYTMPMLLGLGAAAVALLQRYPLMLQRIAFIAFLGFAIYYQWANVQKQSADRDSLLHLFHYLEQKATQGEDPMVFNNRTEHYPFLRAYPHRQNRCFFLLSDPKQASFRPAQYSDNLGGEVIEKLYGQPKTIPFDALPALKAFYLITQESELMNPDGDYPEFHLYYLRNNVYYAVKK